MIKSQKHSSAYKQQYIYLLGQYQIEPKGVTKNISPEQVIRMLDMKASIEDFNSFFKIIDFVQLFLIFPPLIFIYLQFMLVRMRKKIISS